MTQKNLTVKKQPRVFLIIALLLIVAAFLISLQVLSHDHIPDGIAGSGSGHSGVLPQGRPSGAR